MYIYDGLLHLLRLLLGDLAEPLPLGAHDLPLPVSDQLLVILKEICNNHQVAQCLAHSSLSSLTPFLETMGLWYLMSWSVSTKP